MPHPACSLALILAAPAVTQGITLAEGGDLRDLTIRVLQEADPTAAGTVILEGVEFLDIEITGRTVQDQDTSRPRRLQRHGLWRVELPGAARLMRYRRDGGQHHGFLWIPGDGFATVVLEQVGTGATGLESPFADRIAVAPDGLHAAVPFLNGGLELLRLDGGTHSSTGTARRFVHTSVPVIPSTLMVGTHAFFLTEDDRLWRCPLTDGSPPEDVSPPAVPDARFKDEMVISEDGSTIVFLFGPKEQQNLWLLRGSGAATVLPPPASKYEEPDYLPEGTGHSRMLLNRDGTRLLYTDNADRDEIFLLDTAASTPNHITSDANFAPYIGVGILPMFALDSLLVAIGNPDHMDWFLAGAEGGVSNLTLTGPSGTPFGEGVLDPENAVLTLASLLVTESTPEGNLRLRSMTPNLPQGQILYGDLRGDLVPGNHFTGRADLLVMGKLGDRLLDGNTGAELGASPPGVSLSPPARGPSGSVTLFRAYLDTGLAAAIFRMPDGTLLAAPAEFGLEQAVLTSGGGALLNGATLRYLAPGIFTVIPESGSPVRWVLSGAES